MGEYDFQPQKNSDGTKTATKFFTNPLPVPKRRAHVEMDYDYFVPEEKMHFDIEEPNEDFFDI